MQPPEGQFKYTLTERVIFGPGRISVLSDELESRGLKRALIITGHTLGASPLLDRVRSAIGPRVAGVFTGASQHVPSRTVAAATEMARAVSADCLVSFGGGSPIDTAKAVAVSLVGGRVQNRIDMGTPRPIASDPPIPHFAIPTTLSAAEFTPIGGVTDESTGLKGGVSEPPLVPRVVILDPELTVETPNWLWTSTAIRALDHAVETAYSVARQELTDTLATRAIRLLRTHLTVSIDPAGAEYLAHRGYCQIAAWLSMFGIINARGGPSHAMGHQMGPKWKIPHGVTSCITLPHVMRFMAGVAPERFGPIAEGFGIEFDAANPAPAALLCAERAAEFIASLGVPTRMRDVGVPREEIGEIIETVQHEVDNAATVGRPVTQDELMAIADAAW